MARVRQSRWFVFVLGVIAVIGILVITGINGCGAADKFGKVSVPGERALELDEGTYSVYYQEHVNLGENESLHPPGGISIRVRGLGGAPAPELDLGGLSSQIDVNGKVSVSIGKLGIPADGRYGMVVGPSTRPADRPAITLGETFGDTARHAVKPLLVALLGTAALFALLTVVARRARPEPAPAVTPPPPSAPAPPPDPTPPAPQPPPQAAPSSPPSGVDQSRLDSLQRLQELRDQGVLSDAEFERMKKNLSG